MNSRPIDLPDYRKPPISEVVLSLQFKAVEDLRTPLIGLLWDRFRERLPEIEEHPPLPHIIERFGAPTPPKINVLVEQKPPVPRVWFLTSEKTELIQVQQDRFIHNWRKISGKEPYPHYPAICQKFREEVAELGRFLTKEKLGPIDINQCEITYVNQIEAGQLWKSHGDISAILRYWKDLERGGFLPQAEDVALRVRYIIPDDSGKPIGRLHLVVQPAWKSADNMPVLTMNLTARGKPLTDDVEGAFAFFDLGRRWIVKGFADLTTEKIQREAWERIQ